MINRSLAANRQVWTDRIERFERTEQTVAQFCQAESVSPASFYQWRRKLRPKPESTSQTLAKFVPVTLPRSQAPQPSTVMSVDLPGGVRVRLEVTSTEAPQP